jgi:hypothetical protein
MLSSAAMGTQAGLRDRGKGSCLRQQYEAENESVPTSSVLAGAQAGEQDARSGDLRKCIAEPSQESCPR